MSVIVRSRLRHAAEAARRGARRAQRVEVGAHRLGGIEVLHRQHRADAVDQFQRQSTVDAGASAVGHGLGIAARDVGLETQRLARRDDLVVARLAGQAGHGPPGEVELGHRRPGGQLAHGFGHQRGREARRVRRHGVVPFDVLAGAIA